VLYPWKRTEIRQVVAAAVYHLAMGTKAILTSELEDDENEYRVEIDYSSKVSYTT